MNKLLYYRTRTFIKEISIKNKTNRDKQLVYYHVYPHVVIAKLNSSL